MLKIPEYISRIALAERNKCSASVLAKAEQNDPGVRYLTPRLAPSVVINGQAHYRLVDALVWEDERRKQHLGVFLSRGVAAFGGPLYEHYARDLTKSEADLRAHMKRSRYVSSKIEDMVHLFREERARVLGEEIGRLRQLVPMDFQLTTMRWWEEQNRQKEDPGSHAHTNRG